MKRIYKKYTKIGGLLIGILTGLLIGLTLHVIIPSSNLVMWIFVILPIILMLYVGFKHPIVTETTAYVISLFILIAIFGNLIGGIGLPEGEIILGIGAIGLIIANMIVGNINRKMNKLKLIAFRTVGYK